MQPAYSPLIPSTQDSASLPTQVDDDDEPPKGMRRSISAEEEELLMRIGEVFSAASHRKDELQKSLSYVEGDIHTAHRYLLDTVLPGKSKVDEACKKLREGGDALLDVGEKPDPPNLLGLKLRQHRMKQMEEYISRLRANLELSTRAGGADTDESHTMMVMQMRMDFAEARDRARKNFEAFILASEQAFEVQIDQASALMKTSAENRSDVTSILHAQRLKLYQAEEKAFNDVSKGMQPYMEGKRKQLKELKVQREGISAYDVEAETLQGKINVLEDELAKAGEEMARFKKLHDEAYELIRQGGSEPVEAAIPLPLAVDEETEDAPPPVKTAPQTPKAPPVAAKQAVAAPPKQEPTKPVPPATPPKSKLVPKKVATPSNFQPTTQTVASQRPLTEDDLGEEDGSAIATESKGGLFGAIASIVGLGRRAPSKTTRDEARAAESAPSERQAKKPRRDAESSPSPSSSRQSSQVTVDPSKLLSPVSQPRRNAN